MPISTSVPGMTNSVWQSAMPHGIGVVGAFGLVIITTSWVAGSRSACSKIFEQEGLEFVLDSTVDGGKVSFGHGALSVDVFGGWIDRFGSDLKDLVYGGALGWNQKNLGELKLNFLGSELKKDSARGNRKRNSGIPESRRSRHCRKGSVLW